jgi:Tol biopolymer transport system component
MPPWTSARPAGGGRRKVEPSGSRARASSPERLRLVPRPVADPIARLGRRRVGRGRAAGGSILALALATALVVARPALAASGADDDDNETRWNDAPQSPTIYWRTLQTAHFRIHFYESERYIAGRAAIIAERAYTSLTLYLNWEPRGRIDITFIDNTDSANGFASSLPNNFIYGYGVPPEPLSSLNDFDDWLDVLISHELTHVVHLDTILGLPRLIDMIFGKIVAPNLVQPNWFIEGLAVLNESRVTTAGRIRSSIYDMYLRAAVLEDRFLDIDAVSNGPLAFPYGEAAYLYGSHFLKYLEERFGSEKLREISHRYASRLIPFGLNRVSREVYGLRFDQLWEDWHETLRRRYAVTVDEVTRRGITPARRLTFDGEGPIGSSPGPGISPRYFADGRGVLMLREDGTERPEYVLLDPRTGQKRDLLEAHSAGGASPTYDGRSLIFQQVAPQPLPRRIGGGDAAGWDDLFRADLTTGKIVRLTRGQRAHQPDVSRDGHSIVCTVGWTPGTQQLAILPFEGGVPRVLIQNAPGEIAYSPSFSPDGRRIAYSRFKPGGFHDIHVFDLDTNTDRELTHDRAVDVEPRFSPDGRYVLWSSDRTGIYNIFAYDLGNDRMYQVTNILGGAFQPTVSPDLTTLVFSGYSADGYDLYSMPYTPDRWPSAVPFANPRDDARPVTWPKDAPPPIQREFEYQPWKYLYPRSWGPPTLSRNDLGLGIGLGVTVNASDPAAIHSASLTALIPTALDPSVGLFYNYARFWPLLSFGLTRAATTETDLYIDGRSTPYRRHLESGSASLSLPVLRTVEANADLSFYYRYLDYGPADPLPVADPTALATGPPEMGPYADFGVGWSFSNAHAWNQSISNQEGRSLALNVSFSDPSLGSRFHTAQVNWTWSEYFTPPWSRLQAFAFEYAGGVGSGDKRSLYSLGGFAHQDLVRSLFYQSRQCCFFLQGYPPESINGDQFHLLDMEYRAPIWKIERGYATFPVYLRRIHGAILTNVGNAFYGDVTAHGWKVGVGAELRLDFKLGYYYESLLQFGVAKGLSTGGITDYYWVTSFPIF